MRERERQWKMQRLRNWENSGSTGNSNTWHQQQCCTALYAQKLEEEAGCGGLQWNFYVFQYISTGLGIRKPPVLVGVISFSCYVLMWCSHASNAQKLFTRKFLTWDGNLRLPHEIPRNILQISRTKRPLGTIRLLHHPLPPRRLLCYKTQ